MSHKIVSMVIACAATLAAWQPAVAAGNQNPTVAPSSSQPYGMTYGQWNAHWWQWFFSVPASKNPGLATNGAVDCTVGQSGSVWFLAGSFQTSGSFSRSCTIPAGKALLIPLINSWADNVCNNPALTVDQLRASAASGVIPASNLSASVDGTAFMNLQSFRAISPVFSYTLPPSPDNVIDAVFGVSLPGSCWPSLTVSPAVADGFYLMLTPLTSGTHTFKFGGSGPGGSQDITYSLTIMS